MTEEREQKRKIIVVDDEAPNRRLLQKLFEQEYEVRAVESGEECLNLAGDFCPDVYLLDIMMPGGMNGYDLCEKIRQRHNDNQPLIIFLSALSSLDDKLKGYRVGGDDYITKPIELPVLSSKVALHFEKLNSIEEGTISASEAMSMAMTAMTNGGEIGKVNLFLEQLNRAESYQDVAQEVVNICKEFGVSAAIQIRGIPQYINMSTIGEVNTLEEELMVAARNARRIYTFGNRCLFNFKDVTLLIRQMPENEDKAGRYRDHLASVMNGVEARNKSLHTELMLKSQNESLVIEALKSTHKALDEMMNEFQRNDARTSEILENLSSEMHLAFSYLDLEEEQEEYLMNVLSKHGEALNESSSNGNKLDQKFHAVIDNLQRIVNPT